MEKPGLGYLEIIKSILRNNDSLGNLRQGDESRRGEYIVKIAEKAIKNTEDFWSNCKNTEIATKNCEQVQKNFLHQVANHAYSLGKAESRISRISNNFKKINQVSLSSEQQQQFLQGKNLLEEGKDHLAALSKLNDKHHRARHQKSVQPMEREILDQFEQLLDKKALEHGFVFHKSAEDKWQIVELKDDKTPLNEVD